MNIKEIDKWLDNEYGCSYTRLEELHDYFFEKYTDQKEEIKRLNNIINEFDKWLLGKQMILYRGCDNETLIRYGETRNKWLELKGSNKE